MKILNFKKFKHIFLALLLSFTVILGTACGNGKENEKKQKVEENQKTEEKNKETEKKQPEKSDAEKSEENRKNLIQTKMDENTKRAFKQAIENLNKNYEGKMIVKYEEEKNELIFEYIGDIKDNISNFMGNKDDEVAKKVWETLVASQVKYSETIKVINPGMSIVILNPKDRNQELLRIKDGAVEYNHFK